MRFRLARCAVLCSWSLALLGGVGCTPRGGARAGAPEGAAGARGPDPFTFRPAPAAPDESQPGKDADASASWDVQDPPGPRSTVSIDTDEGTWMSVDVSPDGNTVVFDLLGDLYRLPIEGGTAQSLNRG